MKESIASTVVGFLCESDSGKWDSLQSGTPKQGGDGELAKKYFRQGYILKIRKKNRMNVREGIEMVEITQIRRNGDGERSENDHRKKRHNRAFVSARSSWLESEEQHRIAVIYRLAKKMLSTFLDEVLEAQISRTVVKTESISQTFQESY